MTTSNGSCVKQASSPARPDLNASLVRLRQRLADESRFFRLSRRQAIVLLLLAAWPWFVHAFVPDENELALLPVILFLPIGYLFGALAVTAAPDWRFAYPAGVSFAVFVQAWLLLASWRVRRAVRKPLPGRQTPP